MVSSLPAKGWDKDDDWLAFDDEDMEEGEWEDIDTLSDDPLLRFIETEVDLTPGGWATLREVISIEDTAALVRSISLNGGDRWIDLLTLKVIMGGLSDQELSEIDLEETRGVEDKGKKFLVWDFLENNEYSGLSGSAMVEEAEIRRLDAEEWCQEYLESWNQEK